MGEPRSILLKQALPKVTRPEREDFGCKALNLNLVVLFTHTRLLVLPEGGPLPGLVSGLLSNPQK